MTQSATNRFTTIATSKRDIFRTCRVPLPPCLTESQASRFNTSALRRVFDWIASVLGAIKVLKHGVQKAMLLWDMYE